MKSLRSLPMKKVGKRGLPESTPDDKPGTAILVCQYSTIKSNPILVNYRHLEEVTFENYFRCQNIC